MTIPNINVNSVGVSQPTNVNRIGVSKPAVYTIYGSQVSDVQVQSVYVPSWMITQPNVDYLLPPVIINVGNPVVDMPGCVKMHKDNKRHNNGVPIDKGLIENDPKQAMTVCPDGSYPSYDAMNYEPDQLIITTEQEAPPVAPPPEPDITTPETPNLPKTGNEKPDCPGPTSLRIGAVGPSEKEKVVGHELQKTPQGTWVCVELYEDIGIVEAYLPSAAVATTTASIAAVAGASALLAKPLADLLLKVFKPAIKQVLNKVNKILGKTPYRLTESEKKTNEYRVKKGLLEIPFAKNHAKKEKERKKKEKK